MPRLNASLQSLGDYPSKSISNRARLDGEVLDLSIGQPAFGPPDYCVSNIGGGGRPSDPQWFKRYEDTLGMEALRGRIAEYYRRRYHLVLDPISQILITHGATEAIAVAILAISEAGRSVLLTDPTYTLYARSAISLQRTPAYLSRPADRGLAEALDDASATAQIAGEPSCFIVNSPENPTGYVLTAEDWAAVSRLAARHDLWVVHDEAYDSMVFRGVHRPALAVDGLQDRAILVNTLSKKFGTPGLRIGWLCGPAPLVQLAARVHDCLNLGVNRSSEEMALAMLDHPDVDRWLTARTQCIEERAARAQRVLQGSGAFSWVRAPEGGMFLFPDVSGLFEALPSAWRRHGASVGDAVAAYLFGQLRVATVPGSVYGSQGKECVRLVLSTQSAVFEEAIQRMHAAASELRARR